VVRAGDFLISKRQIVHDACGLGTQELDGSVVSNEYSALTPRTDCDIIFFNLFAQQPCVSASFLQCSAGIVIEKMLFKLSAWEKREFLFPSLAEQQKIAECLSSVDELMAAQARKVNALKTHKKGLMQQLFPSPDEVEA
jgi:type I restriction enzyme S subunit